MTHHDSPWPNSHHFHPPAGLAEVLHLQISELRVHTGGACQPWAWQGSTQLHKAEGIYHGWWTWRMINYAGWILHGSVWYPRWSTDIATLSFEFLKSGAKHRVQQLILASEVCFKPQIQAGNKKTMAFKAMTSNDKRQNAKQEAVERYHGEILLCKPSNQAMLEIYMPLVGRDAM